MQPARRRLDDARRASSSIVTDAAFCMSERNRATSSPATSQRRRSVRSRTLSTSSVAERRADELDQPPAVGPADPQLERRPDFLGLHAREREHRDLQVVGVDEVEPVACRPPLRAGCRTAARPRGWPSVTLALGSTTSTASGSAVATAARAATSVTGPVQHPAPSVVIGGSSTPGGAPLRARCPPPEGRVRRFRPAPRPISAARAGRSRGTCPPCRPSPSAGASASPPGWTGSARCSRRCSARTGPGRGRTAL